MADRILQVRIISGRDLVAADSNGLSDPYVVIKYNEKKCKTKTRVIKKTLNPDWNQIFSFQVQNPSTDVIKFIVYDKDKIGSDFIGEAEVQINDLIEKVEKSMWLKLQKVPHGDILVGLMATNWSGQPQPIFGFSSAPQYYHQPVPVNYQFSPQAMGYVTGSNPYGAVPFVAPMDAAQHGFATVPAVPMQRVATQILSESSLREGYNINYSEITWDKKIAQGAFGEVWRATWAGTVVAAKKILKTEIGDSDLAEFSQEILLMSKLRHPNIVQFLGACLEPEICLLTEYFERGSLFDVLAKRDVEIDWARKLQIIYDITSGFVYLHTRNPPVIHRDVKSMNVLVTKDWKCSVADFGLTKIKDKAMLSTRCGSPAWSAPEVLRGEPYDEKADVFSYGIVLWEVITRSPPYRGMNPMQVIGQVAYQRPSLRPPIPNDCPVIGLIDLTTRCWDDNPATRPTFPQALEAVKVMRADWAASLENPQQP